MTDNQTYRIVKVAAELGVGFATVVEHLNKKGYSVENKPTSKVTQEMYDLLLKDFKSDKAARDEAKQLEVHKLRETKEATDVIAKPRTKTAGNEDGTDFAEDEILIKDQGVGKPAEMPKKEDEPAPKVPVKETIVPVAEIPVVAAEKTPEIPAKIVEPVKEQQPEEEQDQRVELKVVGKIDLSTINSKTKPVKKDKRAEPEKTVELPKAETKKEVPAPEVTVVPDVVVPVPVAEKIEKVEKQEVKETPAPEVIAKDTTAPTIVKKEEEAAPVIPPTVIAPEDIDRHEVIKPNYEKLQGLKVMGKIVLPVDQPKKKPVASSDGAHDGKKKRKRKLTGGPADTRPANTTNTGTPGSNPNPRFNNNNNRPNTGGPNNRPAPNNRFGNNTTGGNRFQSSRPNEPKEITQKEIQDKLKQTLARLNPGNKNPSGNVRSKMRRQKRDIHAQSREDAAREMEADKKVLKVTEFISANELAKMMDVSVNEVITACFSLGMMVSINQRLDAEAIAIIADEFGYDVQFVGADAQEEEQIEIDDPEDLVPRPPIVTVMGHVDHGKTSLLDYVRSANVIAGEAGGITQHIGAYEVTLKDGKKITFLDTPGHEAFTAMRARGAKLTDVAIIVIAADDSVMPQTREAIAHAQAAGVPIVFALNKIDKEGANPDKVREQLAAMNILVEEWGGKFQCQEISAKKGLNIEVLLEKVLLEAEILDLKANPNKRANGSVIEAQLDKGRGIVTTIMVQSGTLRVGDPIVAGVHSGRVKALFNERGKKIEFAGPSTPVTVLGFSGAPQAGDKFVVTENEQEAREISNKRQQLQREQGLRTQKHITLDEIGRRLAIGNFKELNVIVKGDVDGSVEALADSLLKLSTKEIQVNVIHKSVGQISESDVMLASASDAIIVGFQVRPSQQAKKLAENEGIEIRHYSIIYKAIEEIKDAMEGMLEPEIEEKSLCTVEIRDVFKVSKVGTIAGCYVLDGKITRNTKIRLVRDGVVLHTGELESLKRFKDDVKEVTHGYECGISIKNFNDIEVKDIIEGFEEVEVKRKLK